MLSPQLEVEKSIDLWFLTMQNRAKQGISLKAVVRAFSGEQFGFGLHASFSSSGLENPCLWSLNCTMPPSRAQIWE